jgi:hypothetical protein
MDFIFISIKRKIMKRTLFTALITLFALNLSAEEPAFDSAQQDAQVESHLVAQNDPMMMGNNCDSMSPDQKSFAMQLSASNKSMFCNQFTPAQRASAMQLSGTMNNGVKMTPDMSVEQVAKGGASTSRAPGGCPVR